MSVRLAVVHACLLAGLGASRVVAQEAPPTSPPLTLEQAVDQAVAANPSLLAVQGERGMAAARPAMERFLMPPMVEGQVFQWPLNTINPADVQVMVTLQQEFPGRGKRALRVARAEREMEKVEAAVAVRRRDVIADVKAAYLEILLARDLVTSFESSLELTDRLTAAAEAQYASGGGTQQAVVQALLERARIEQDILMAREQEEMAAARLNTLRGRDPLLPAGPLERPVEQPFPPADVVQQAVAPDHPELQMIAAEAGAIEAERAVIEADRRPDYVVQGGYMRMPMENDAWTGRVGLTWPTAPWTRGRLDAQRRELDARRAALLASEKAVTATVATMVREAWVKASSADARAALIRTRLLPRTEQSLALARLGYESGDGTFAEVIEALRARVELQRDLVRADGDRWLALIALERALGGSLGPLVSTSGERR